MEKPTRVSTTRNSKTRCCCAQISEPAAYHGFGPRLRLSATRARRRVARGVTVMATCWLQPGRADVMLDPVMNLWDCAPLLPIMEEAGGTFTDWRGERTVDRRQCDRDEWIVVRRSDGADWIERWTMIVIPAIDLRNGRCVRLMQGRKSDVTVYNEDPVAVAKEFAAAGAEMIHVVDLDGAFQRSRFAESRGGEENC